MYLQPGLNLLTNGLPLLGGGGGIPPLFTTNFEAAQTVQSGFDLIRASERSVLTTTDGTTYWLQTAKVNELRLWGERRVENLQNETPGQWTKQIGGSGVFPVVNDNFADGVAGASLTASRAQLDPGGTGSADRSRLRHDVSPVDSGHYVNSVWLRLNTGTSADIILGALAAAATITVTDQWQRFSIASSSTTLIARLELEARGNFNGGAAVDLLIDDGTQYGAQMELGQVNGFDNLRPSEFVYRGTEYNAGVNGVRYFATTNADSIDPSTHLIIPGAKATITGGAFLRERATTYLALDSNDYNAASWTLNDITPTDIGITGIGYRTHRMNLSTTNALHRMFQSVTMAAGDPNFALLKGETAQYVVIGPGPDEFGTFDIINGVVTQEIGGKAYIYDFGDGWYWCVFHANSQGFFLVLGVVDTATPATRDEPFLGANETCLVANMQVADAPTFSPFVTTGSTAFVQADSLSGGAWPTETSALVDCTVLGNNGNLAALLGFSLAADRFSLPNTLDTDITNGTISAAATAADTLEQERHKLAFSLKDNEGIVVNDEGDTGTDLAGTTNQGTIFVGSSADLLQAPVLIHLWNVYDQTQTVEELQALVGIVPAVTPAPLRVWSID